MSNKYNLRIIGIAEERTIWHFTGQITSHVLPRENFDWGVYETVLEIKKDEALNRRFLYEMGDIDEIILCGNQMDLEREVKVGKNDLNLSFDDGDFKRENRKLVIKKGAKIENNNSSLRFSSSHSATASATKDTTNNIYEPEETNHNHGAEAENNSDNNETPTLWEQENVKPEANLTTGSVESEEVVKIRKVIEKGQKILKSNDIKDVSEMKKITQALEDFEKRGSTEAKNELFLIEEYKDQFNELLNSLKGKAAAIELEKQQSGSSQPDHPTQPSQDEILASIQRENEAKKNDVDKKLSQAESENATKEEVAEAIKDSASNFGDENFQEHNERQEALEDKLSVEDPELYFQTMLEKVNVSLKANNLTETELKLSAELKNQWIKFKRAEIQEKDQVKPIVQKMQEQIIRQANEKELKSIQERVKKCQEGGFSKTERANLVKDCMKYVEKSRNNSYTRANSSKGEALLRELNNSSKPEITKSNEFPWVPVSLGIGAVGILAVVALIIKNKKTKK